MRQINDKKMKELPHFFRTPGPLLKHRYYFRTWRHPADFPDKKNNSLKFPGFSGRWTPWKSISKLPDGRRETVPSGKNWSAPGTARFRDKRLDLALRQQSKAHRGGAAGEGGSTPVGRVPDTDGGMILKKRRRKKNIGVGGYNSEGSELPLRISSDTGAAPSAKIQKFRGLDRLQHPILVPRHSGSSR